MLPRLKTSLNPLRSPTKSFSHTLVPPPSTSDHNNQMLMQAVEMLNQSVAGLVDVVAKMQRVGKEDKGDGGGLREGEVGEVRFRDVVVDIPVLERTGSRLGQLEIFLSTLANKTFTHAFNSFMQGSLTQPNFRLLTCHSLLSNMTALIQKNKLTTNQVQHMDRHLSQRILPYLKYKYPQAQKKQALPGLLGNVRELDNFASSQNCYVAASGVVFLKKDTSDYGVEIMRVLNYILSLPRSKLDDEHPQTLYTNFERDMTTIFGIADNEQSILQSKKGIFPTLLKPPQAPQLPSTRSAHPQQKKYQIGKKLSDSIPAYSAIQLSQQCLTLKHPNMTRVLTKWCEELEKIFNTEESIIFREEMFRMRDGSQRYLSRDEKSILAECLERNRQDLAAFLHKVRANLFGNLSGIVATGTLGAVFRDFCSQGESRVGYLTCVMAKCNENYLISYLNKLIDSILDAEQAWMRRMSHKAHYKQEIPTLISFNIGDLIRCKHSSNQSQTLSILNYLKHISDAHPEVLQIIRLKNRLSLGTKDLLINFRYRGTITAEMQLAVEQSKSNFIKCSDKANHFIYQLERASFGPISEMANICYHVDYRSLFFMNQFQDINQWGRDRHDDEEGQGDGGDRCQHRWEFQMLPIKCFQCNTFNAGTNLPIPHKQCQICSKTICSKCQISHGELQELSITQSSLNWQSEISSMKLTNKAIKKLTTMDTTKKLLNLKTTILYKTDNKILLCLTPDNPPSSPSSSSPLPQIQIHKQIKHSQEQKWIKKLQSTVRIVRVQQVDIEEQNRLAAAIRAQIVADRVRDVIAKGKGVFLADDVTKGELGGLKGSSLDWVRKISFKGVGLTDVDWMMQVFPLCQIAMLSNNPQLHSFNKIPNWKSLKILHLDYNYLPNFPQELSTLSNLQILNMSHNRLKAIDENMCKLGKLKKLILERNQIVHICGDIAMLANLEVLWLKSNKLSQIPAQLGKLQKLKYLILDQNSLQHLPTELSSLHSLQLLNLTKNNLLTLPNSLFLQMPRLKDLWLYQNKLQHLPTSFNKLINLTRFSAHGNPLKQLPMGIDRMGKLEYFNLGGGMLEGLEGLGDCGGLGGLMEFKIGGNRIRELSRGVGRLRGLKCLSVHDNPLGKLIPQLCQLRKLQSLYTHNICLTAYPPSLCILPCLHTLTLQNNFLTCLPPQFHKLTSLKTLDLSNNKLSIFPQQILGMQKLAYLSLGGNLIVEVPVGVCQMKGLIVLGIAGVSRVCQGLAAIPKLEHVELNISVLEPASLKIYQQLMKTIYQRCQQK